jgi:hypothetical protein
VRTLSRKSLRLNTPSGTIAWRVGGTPWADTGSFQITSLAITSTGPNALIAEPHRWPSSLVEAAFPNAVDGQTANHGTEDGSNCPLMVRHPVSDFSSSTLRHMTEVPEPMNVLSHSAMRPRWPGGCSRLPSNSQPKVRDCSNRLQVTVMKIYSVSSSSGARTSKVLLGALALAFASGLPAQTLTTKTIGIPTSDKPPRTPPPGSEVLRDYEDDKSELASWRDAVRLVRLRSDSVDRLLRLVVASPKELAAWMKSDGRTDLDGATFIYTVAGAVGRAIASRDLKAVSTRASQMKVSAYRDSLIEVATQLRKFTDERLAVVTFEPSVGVFAEGNIKSIATGSAARGTSANGTLGIEVDFANTTWVASINAASTADTLRQSYSQLVLSPAVGATLLSGLVDFRRQHSFWRGASTHVYVTGSRSVWKDTTIKTGDTARAAASATVLGAGVLLSWTIADGKVKDSPVGLLVEGGVALRHIGGDIGSESAFLQRPNILGTQKRDFVGVEAGPQLRFGNVIGALHVYFFPGPKAAGITGFQLVGGLSLKAPILNGPLKP